MKTFKINQTDITEGIDNIIEIIETILNQYQNPKEIASSIKQTCDNNFGQYWHCIVGKSFASDVSHGNNQSLKNG